MEVYSKIGTSRNIIRRILPHTAHISALQLFALLENNTIYTGGSQDKKFEKLDLTQTRECHALCVRVGRPAG